MSFKDLVAAGLTALVGGAGIVGLAMYYLRRYIDKKLADEENAASERVALRQRRLRVEDRLQHAYGRMFFWLHRAIVTGQHNGDLEAAWTQLQRAEEEKKELDREIIAAYRKE